MSHKTLDSKFEPVDPTGRGQHEPGAKMDGGKQRPALVLGGFARALEDVVRVGTYGAAKYTDNGWLEVPQGEQRYADAMHRHLLRHMTGEVLDSESGIPHLAHAAWNILALLELSQRAEQVEPSKPAYHPAQNSTSTFGGMYGRVRFL